MAGKVEMKDEIIKGIFGGLGMVLVVVTIGSLIGSALSHGPAEKADTAGTEQAAPAGADGEKAAESGEKTEEAPKP